MRDGLSMTPAPNRPRAQQTLERASRHQAAGDLDAAIAAYEEALRLDEGLHAAWFEQACAWEAKGDDARALVSYERAASLEPRHVPSQHNLGKVLHTLGLTDQAVSRFRLALDAGGGFRPRTALATIIPGAPGADQRGILLARREWAEMHLPPRDRTAESGCPPRPDGKIRVGYLSSFLDRDNWMKPVWGLVNHQDRGRIAVHLFSDAPLANCRGCYRAHPDDRFRTRSRDSPITPLLP